MLIGQNVSFIAYHVITIFYLIFGVSGRVITLFSIYKETSTDGAYLYQIFVLISEISEITTFSIFVFVVYWWCGFFDAPGAMWFRQCYACMWFTGYLSTPLQNAFMSCTLLLTLAMSFDRILSLAKPQLHARLPHKQIQWATFLLCFIVGALTSIPFGMILEVNEGQNGTYSLGISKFHGTTFQYAWTEIHNVFKISSTMFLFVSNFVLYGVHRKRMMERAKVQNANEKASHSSTTLFKMTLCQSTLNTLGQLALVSYHIAEYQMEHFFECYAFTFGAFVDVVMQTADTIEFYCMLAISRSFRRMVAKTLRNMFGWVSCGQNRIEDTGGSLGNNGGVSGAMAPMVHRHE